MLFTEKQTNKHSYTENSITTSQNTNGGKKKRQIKYLSFPLHKLYLRLTRRTCSGTKRYMIFALLNIWLNNLSDDTDVIFFFPLYGQSFEWLATGMQTKSCSTL